MSIRVIDMLTPVALGDFLRVSDALFDVSYWSDPVLITPFIEAAPHYTGIRLKRTISGVNVESGDSTWLDTAPDPDVLKTYTETTTDTYSYTKELSFTRVDFMAGRTGDGHVTPSPEVYTDYWPTETYTDGTDIPIDPETECTMRLIDEPDESQDVYGGRHVYSPIRQMLGITASWVGSAEVVGERVWTVSGDTPPGYTSPATTDIVKDVYLYSPVHTGSYEAGLGPVMWGWPFGIPDGSHPYIDEADWQLDLSAWSETDWRDLRGVHTLSAVDTLGITYTYEWEIF